MAGQGGGGRHGPARAPAGLARPPSARVVMMRSLAADLSQEAREIRVHADLCPREAEREKGSSGGEDDTMSPWCGAG
jgi:hypothetical protein